MSTQRTSHRARAQVAQIWRHPIKSHGREALTRVALAVGQMIEGDRKWAIAHEAARLEDAPAWAPCQNFVIGSKSPRLQAARARYDATRESVTLSHPDLEEITVRPDAPEDQARLIAWSRALCDPGRARSERVYRAADCGLSDTPYPSVSLLSMASLRALEDAAGMALGTERWRGNVWLESASLAPFEEANWIGREIQIGTARLKITEPITRCRATMANTATGTLDCDTLSLLEELGAARDFGVYAEVISSGTVALGDLARVEARP